MVDAILVERIAQHLDHMRLTDEFRELTGPPLSSKNLITHGSENTPEWVSGDARTPRRAHDAD
jgi:hypothetical protein